MKIITNASSPIDDFVFMQELQSEHDTTSVEDRARLRKYVRVNVHHEVTSISKLHHETHVFLNNTSHAHVSARISWLWWHVHVGDYSHIIFDKSYFSLKAAKDVDKEGVPDIVDDLEDALLRHQTLNLLPRYYIAFL